MFYDFLLHTTTKEQTKNSIGQAIDVVRPHKAFYGDLQPVSQSVTDSINNALGGDRIDIIYNLFTDEEISLGDVVIYNEQTFLVYKLNKCYDYTQAIIIKREYERAI